MDEEWRQVPGWEGFYAASTLGRIKSLARVINRRGLQRTMAVEERILSPSHGTGGYEQVVLCREGQRRSFKVHYLVAITFIGPRPFGLDVMHLDNNNLNNTPGNLRYGTESENLLMAVEAGTHNMARKTHCPQGHEYTPENTYVTSVNSRMCRKCQKERHRLVGLS